MSKNLIFGQKSPKNVFLGFFSQKSDYFNRFLVKFHSKINIFIYLTLLLFKLWQKRFSPKLTKLRPYHLIKVRQVCEFRDVSEFRDVPEFRKCKERTHANNKNNTEYVWLSVTFGVRKQERRFWFVFLRTGMHFWPSIPLHMKFAVLWYWRVNEERNYYSLMHNWRKIIFYKIVKAK